LGIGLTLADAAILSATFARGQYRADPASMSLAALPTFLLLPPANLLLPACLGAALHRRRAGRVMLGVGLAGLVLFSIPAVSIFLLISLEQGLNLTPPAADPPQAIVVLSGDEEERIEGGVLRFDVGDLTRARARAGAALARRTGLPLLLSGGHIHDYAPALADMMAQSLHDDFGLTAKWREVRSRDTWQNAAFSAAILRENQIGSVYVVTDAWHMRRALIAFRHTGLTATAAPVLIDPPVRLLAENFIPGTKPWETAYLALHEWVGCAWYAWRAR
jgi:uncharacterized SAM-binding protein YcdF (DUF218 family)